MTSGLAEEMVRGVGALHGFSVARPCLHEYTRTVLHSEPGASLGAIPGGSRGRQRQALHLLMQPAAGRLSLLSPVS